MKNRVGLRQPVNEGGRDEIQPPEEGEVGRPNPGEVPMAPPSVPEDVPQSPAEKPRPKPEGVPESPKEVPPLPAIREEPPTYQDSLEVRATETAPSPEANATKPEEGEPVPEEDTDKEPILEDDESDQKEQSKTQFKGDELISDVIWNRILGYESSVNSVLNASSQWEAIKEAMTTVVITIAMVWALPLTAGIFTFILASAAALVGARALFKSGALAYRLVTENISNTFKFLTGGIRSVGSRVGSWFRRKKKD